MAYLRWSTIIPLKKATPELLKSEPLWSGREDEHKEHSREWREWARANGVESSRWHVYWRAPDRKNVRRLEQEVVVMPPQDDDAGRPPRVAKMREPEVREFLDGKLDIGVDYAESNAVQQQALREALTRWLDDLNEEFAGYEAKRKGKRGRRRRAA